MHPRPLFFYTPNVVEKLSLMITTKHPEGPAVRSWVTLVWYDYWSPPVTWHTPVWERPTTSVLSFLDKNHQGREVEHSSQ